MKYIYLYIIEPILRFIYTLMISVMMLIVLVFYYLWYFELPKKEFFQIPVADGFTNRVMYYKSPLHYLLYRRTIEVKLVKHYPNQNTTTGLGTSIQIAIVKVTCNRKFIPDRHPFEPQDTIYV
jgi:hypothetical protein